MTRNEYTLYIFISVFAIQQCATMFRLSVQKYHFLIAAHDLEVCNSERNQQKTSCAQHGASERACELGLRLTVTVRGLTTWLSLDPKGGLGRSVQSSSHELSRHAMTFDDSTSDEDVATDEHAIESYTSSRSSTCLVLAFVALAVVTLGALTCFQTNFPTRANLDRASTMRRNASKRVTTATIATPSCALTRPSSYQIELSRRSCLMATVIVV